ncbi:MAG TPA: HAMP domain-containing sensor histidine kinase [Polyangia bacterium]|nr:HAMP domain-containing sensor histidine kinase [Polyangia bacterium]
MSLTILGALALYTIRRAVVRSNEVVVHERLERHSEVLGRVGLPKFEEAVESATALEGEHDPVRVEDAAGHTLYQHGVVEDAALRVSTTVSSDLKLEIASAANPWRRLGPPVMSAVLLVLIGCLLTGITGGVILTRRALRPVGALASTARAVIQSGDLSRRVEVRGGGELDQLASLVNRMLEKNQALVRSMREALDNVAHDLRTPLTRLRGIAEVALRADDSRQTTEALADCIEESDRALIMLRTLMDISEAEAGIMKLNVGTVELRAVARETVGLYEQVADEAGVALSLMPGADVSALADATRIRQALANLVDNAVKYTPRGGRVEIDVARQEREAQILVRDTGRGIPADALPRIWDRLFRVDPSRAEKGLGLGLSLVKAIALAHHGRVAVESAPGRGSSFLLALPWEGPAAR